MDRSVALFGQPDEAIERFIIMFKTMAEGVIVQDRSGAIVAANPAAERILGLSWDELRGITSRDPRWQAVTVERRPFPGEDHPAIQALRTGEAVRSVIMGVQKPDGTLTWIEVNAEPRRVDGVVTEVMTTFHDVTAIRLANERAAAQDRLATIGTLAAGVAHEVNNPLAYILGNLDFAVDELRTLAGMSPSARMKELLEVLAEAREGAERVRKIVRGLRGLAREDVALQSVDLAATVEVALSIAAHEVRQRARVTTNLEGAPMVLADESRLTQVLVNLLVNSAQAFETRGPATNDITLSYVVRDDGRVECRVADNGPGIPQPLRQRIFDPFFTTKPAGVGTGLGLSVSRNIVDALGGELTLLDGNTPGATFCVILRPAPPASSDAAAPIVAAPRARVAVVDDEPSVVNTIRRILLREHDVTTFVSSSEALAAFEAGQRFDVTFCDLMMPGLSGADLFARVRAIAPDQAERFVFVTGAATTVEAQGFLSEVPNERLDKPFATHDLLRIARRNARDAQVS